MRVIKQPDPVKEMESKCDYCRTVVGCLPEDCRYFSDQRDGDAVVWECPTCRKTNYVATCIAGREFSRAVREGGRR